MAHARVTSCPLCSLHCFQVSSSDHTAFRSTYPAQSLGSYDFDYLLGGLSPIFPVANVQLPSNWPIASTRHTDAEVDAFLNPSRQVEILSPNFPLLSDPNDDPGTRRPGQWRGMRNCFFLMRSCRRTRALRRCRSLGSPVCALFAFIRRRPGCQLRSPFEKLGLSMLSVECDIP